MKVIILAGGFGTRLSEATDVIPKPMVEIGGKPILWHIMKIYSTYGFNEFVLLLGYKGYVIKEYFMNYFLHQSSVEINLGNNEFKFFENKSEPWKITLLETGLNTMTGGRIKYAKKLVGDEAFFLTYGDGLSDVNIRETLSFHQEHGKAITMTSIQPPSRYGALNIEKNNFVADFLEKPEGEGSWINGGFFVVNSAFFKILTKKNVMLEREPIQRLLKKNQIGAFRHEKFWYCMDNLRDKNVLKNLIKTKKAPWLKNK